MTGGEKENRNGTKNQEDVCSTLAFCLWWRGRHGLEQNDSTATCSTVLVLYFLPRISIFD